MKIATAYALAWISTAIAVGFSVWVTKSAGCLWALLLPATISISNKSTGKDKKESD